MTATIGKLYFSLYLIEFKCSTATIIKVATVLFISAKSIVTQIILLACHTKYEERGEPAQVNKRHSADTE